MTRGELYRVRKPGGRDPRQARVFVVVSRQPLVDSSFPTVICAPVHSGGEGLSTQIPVGIEEGLKQDSFVLCDGLVSIAKNRLSNFVGTLSPRARAGLDQALAVALGLD